MNTLQERIQQLSSDRLAGIRRGIEKEGLRVLPTGGLALTPHPVALGSALTHPHITTDYSESQIELITGAHQSVSGCLDELIHIHQYVLRTLAGAGGEMLWVSSMPCGLPTDETIPIGRYGNSHIGRAKSRPALRQVMAPPAQPLAAIAFCTSSVPWAAPLAGTCSSARSVTCARRCANCSGTVSPRPR